MGLANPVPVRQQHINWATHWLGQSRITDLCWARKLVKQMHNCYLMTCDNLHLEKDLAQKMLEFSE